MSSITIWLAGHPEDLEAYTPLAEKPVEQSALRSLKRKRTILGEMSNNIEPEKRRSRSPRKLDTSSATQRTPRSAKRDILDIDATPRPTTGLAGPVMLPLRYTASDGDVSPSRSSNSSVARSSSPVKRIGDLQLLSTKIKFVGFNSRQHPLPELANNLYLRIKMIFAEEQVIPEVVKHKAADLIANFEIHNRNFYRGLNRLLPKDPPGSFNHEVTWNLVGETIKKAQMCEDDLAPEAQWNTQVHARVFDIVLEGWRESRSLWYMDATSARIHNYSASKMVDYVFVITPDWDLHEKITHRLKGLLEPTINHTKAEHLRYKPISVSFETKKPGTDGEGANVQLGVWAAAHLQRLKDLSDMTAGNVPFLPQVIIQGHYWQLKFASATANGEVVLHGDVDIGNTRSYLGIYKLIAALRCLADWSVNDFKPWFVENCLD